MIIDIRFRRRIRALPVQSPSADRTLAESEQDVVNAVKMAAEGGMKIGIRSGGHSWVANGIRDGGLMIDLSRMQELEIDVAARTVAVSPGVRSRDFNKRLGREGLYIPGGHCPTVALGGFLLGAGFGWNAIERGVGASSVFAIDVVTPDDRSPYECAQARVGNAGQRQRPAPRHAADHANAHPLRGHGAQRPPCRQLGR